MASREPRTRSNASGMRSVTSGAGTRIKQLTWRAVIMGWALGGVLSLTNIYIGLKAGWAFGVAITACILSYAIWTGFYRTKLARTQMTILENNCMQSTASAAGYSTGGTLISAFAAYILINNATLPLSLMLGVGLLRGDSRCDDGRADEATDDQRRAAPIPQRDRRRRDAPGPSREGREGDPRRARPRDRRVLAALSAFLTDGLRLISPSLESLQISSLVTRFNAATLGAAWTGRTVAFAWDPIFIAAGMFVGMRVGVSMLVGLDHLLDDLRPLASNARA